MNDLEIRQKAWDKALVKSWREAERLSKVFFRFARELGIPQGEKVDFDALTEGLKRIPPKSVFKRMAAPAFVAQFLPQLNQPMYDMFFRDRSVDHMVFVIGRSQVDTAPKLLGGNYTSQVSRNVHSFEGRIEKDRELWEEHSKPAQKWHQVKATPA